MSAAFLLNGRYQPYYKWSFRALRELPQASSLAQPLETLLTGGGVGEIERVAAVVAALVRDQQLSDVPDDELERHAYAVNDCIRDASIRNLHILAAV